MLQPFSLTGIDETINCKDTKSITLSPAVTRATSEIRRAGTFLPCDEWHDDGIVFTIPKAVGQPIGFIIIWRDDIPSNPVPILDSIDWNQLLERFAKRLFHWNINGINVNWDDKPNNEAINENNPVPIPLTEDTLSLCLDRMVMEANAFLERYLSQFGLDIQFTFQLTPAADSCFSGNDLKNPYVVPIDTQSLSAKPTTGLSFTNLSSINPTCQLTLANLNFNLPWATLYELAANPKNRDFYLESAIKISFRLPIDNPLGIKLPNELLFHLPTVKFTRVLLEIPTMALLFEHADFQGVPMVFMPDNSAIPAFNYDDTDSGQIADIKHKIWQALDVARALLGVTQVFKKSQELEVAGKILEWIDNATHLVINTQGQIADLGQCVIEQKGILGNATFSGIISSIILIGIPGNIGNVSLRCNTDINHHGEILKIAIPDGTFIAAIPNVGYLHNSYTSPFFTTPIPTPAILNTLGPDNSGIYHYNDKIQSLKFEPLNGITRWFNPATRDEFYTQSYYGELSYRNGYQYEGTVFQLFPDYYGDQIGKPSMTTAFYRYFNAKTGIHYYTTDQNVPNFTLEGTLGWIATSQLPGTTELYCWHNPQTGGNFYSTNYGEGTVVQTLGYQYQGIMGWAIPV